MLFSVEDSFFVCLDCVRYLYIECGMQKTISESSLAWWSMFVLGVVLIWVYTIFFSLPKHDEVVAVSSPSQEQEASEDVWVIAPVQIATTQKDSWTRRDEPVQQPTMYTQTTSPQNNSDDALDDWVKQDITRTPTYIVSTNQLFNKETTETEYQVTQPTQPQKTIQEAQILTLAGTHHWVWVMKSAKYLWIMDSVQYILKNNDNTHFAYLGKQLPEVADKLASLWGKSIAITAKNDIHTHWLFGDKIIFLLAPIYVGKKQLFFVYFAEARDRWFIQVDNDIFETTKPLLRELFTKRYNRY